MDADIGQIAAAALTTSDVDDASQVGPLFDEVDGPVASFTADGGECQEFRVWGKLGRKESSDAPPQNSLPFRMPFLINCWTGRTREQPSIRTVFSMR
jgi:hypothetical protein